MENNDQIIIDEIKRYIDQKMDQLRADIAMLISAGQNEKILPEEDFLSPWQFRNEIIAGPVSINSQI